MMYLSALFALSLSALAAMTMAPDYALAQDQTRDYAGPVLTVEDVEDLSVDFDESFNAIDNPYLSDSMRLNYQINLLEKMAERQAELLKISDSFSALGIPFNEPAPARGLCAQLPPNAPCLKHYPDLHAGLVSERKAYYDDLRAKAMQDSGAVIPSDTTDPELLERARKAKEEQERLLAEAKAKAARLERETRYTWSDVSCVASSCTGVVTSPRMAGYRATVRKGARLADGTLITDIHGHGIRAIIEGDRIDLRPTPTENAAQAVATGDMLQLIPANPLGPEAMPEASTAASAAIDAATASNTSGITISSIPAATRATAPATTGATAATSPATPTATGTTSSDAGTTVVEPALGPSGLF